MEKIRIIHTNDLHSHFENWPKIRRYLLAAKDDQSVDQTLTFDLGDFMDRSYPLTEVTDGQINIDLLNQIHYDAVTIGNNEGISNSKAVLEKLFAQANFDVVLGNLFEPSGELPDFVQPFKIITTNKGTKIGVLGLTAAYPVSYEPNGWNVKLINDVLPNLLKEITPKVDFVILLSHLGITMDRYLANHYPALNLIIGSHTHHLLEKGEFDNQSALAAADKWGRFIGDISLEFDDQHQMSKIKIKTVKTADLDEDTQDEAEIEGYIVRGQDLLNEEHVAMLPEEFTNKKLFFDESLHAIAEFVGTYLAILNTGLFLKPIGPGVLTKRDLHQVLPHPMHVVSLKLKGQDLCRMIMEMEKNRNYLRNFHVRGMSFRGKIFGEIKYRGISVDQASRTVYVNGHEVDVNHVYTIAILDHYVFIPYFPTIEIMGEKEFLFPTFFRDVVGNYLAKKYPITKE